MKKHLKLTAILLFTAFVLTCVSVNSSVFTGLGKGTDKIPLTSRAITGTLPNGLRYYIMENSLPENRAYLSLVVNAGSVLERDDQRGYAHFIEHLAFNGTERFPKLEIIEYLRTLGSRFGDNLNAYTFYDQTVYHFDIPVETVNGVKRIPDRVLAVLDDWSHAVTFDPEDVKNESRVIIEEMRTRSGINERKWKIIYSNIFKGSAYENRDVIGLADIIENASPDMLKEFYNRWYRSDNMALIFVGDFDGKALEAELKDHFKKDAPSSPVKRPVHELPPPKSGNFNVQIVTDPEMSNTEIYIYYKQRKSSPRGTLSYYRETIIDYLISEMLDERFGEASLDPASASTDLWGYVWRWSVNTAFYFMGTSAKDNAEEALKQLLTEKEDMRRHGFTESELNRAKLNLVSYFDKLLSEKDRTQSQTYLRYITNNFLFGEDFADIEWEVAAVNALLPGIKLNEIKRTANSYFTQNDINVFLFAPKAEEQNLPSEERIKAIFKEAQNADIIPRIDASVSGELLDEIPSPGKIVSEVFDQPTGSYTLTLSNGAKVILKETENKNNEIIMYAAAKGGSANSTAQTRVSVNLLSEMISASGLGPYSRTELVNKLAGKQVASSFWLHDYYRGFEGASTAQDINTLFEMVNLFFTNPRLDERAIAALISQYKTALARIDEDPQRFFSRQLQKILYSNHPMFKPLELEDMDRVSIEQAIAFLKRCINPGDYTFIFTGNLNLDIMRELSSVYIASIPNNTSMNSWSNPGITRPSEGRRVIYKGRDDRCIVYLTWFARGASGFSEQRNQISSVLSEYLDIALTDEIREEKGGVYSISAWSSIAVIPAGEYRLGVSFVCNPSRADELIKAVRENLTRISRQPINTETFNKAKEALLSEHERAMQSNSHIAQSYANSFVLYNTPLSRLNSRPNTLRVVTSQDMQNFCREILASGPVEIVMYPEN